jgi:hypothetical protein
VVGRTTSQRDCRVVLDHSTITGAIMKNVDRYFIGVGVVAALAGMVLGIFMGVTRDFTLAPAHAHINLVGWASLGFFGLAYRTGVAKNDRWAALHFWIATAGAIILPIGIVVAITKDQAGTAIAGSLLTLASMILFGVNFLRARPA